MENNWNLDDTYYNKEVVICPVYSKEFRGKKGRVYVMDKIKTDLQEYFVELVEEMKKEEEMILHGTGKNIYIGIIKA